MCSKIVSSIRVGFWNVGGLIKKQHNEADTEIENLKKQNAEPRENAATIVLEALLLVVGFDARGFQRSVVVRDDRALVLAAGRW